MRTVGLIPVVLLIGLHGCQEPSPRYRGVSEPPKQVADEHVSFSGPPAEPPDERRPPGHGTRGDVETPPALATGGPEQRAREALDGPVQADAVFAPAPGVVSLKGVGQLTEGPQGVQLAVAVRQTPPGERTLSLVDEPRACEEFLGTLPTGPAHVGPGKELGTLSVDRDGRALLKVNVPESNLTKGDKASLLGKSLVLRDGAATKPGESAGKPLACAVITQAPKPE